MSKCVRPEHPSVSDSLAAQAHGVTLKIGEIAVSLRTNDAGFQKILSERYTGYLRPEALPWARFDVEIVPSHIPVGDDDLHVSRQADAWWIQRGDFFAQWDVRTRHGWVRQSANPYSADTLLRIVHSIALAGDGGFLLHAASAVRNGRAFLFSGVSGAGKTTLSRLAPPDVKVLTDEISYVAKEGNAYRAFGTPFWGELARPGENISAPIAGMYFLEKAPANRLLDMDASSAAQALLRNILFLTQDQELVRSVFDSALQFISRVPVKRMQFTPDAHAWELIS